MTTVDTDRHVDAPSRAGTGSSPLLRMGILAGPLFFSVSIGQALLRDGFDLRRHAFSMLSLGDLGWLQITNFVVAGALFTGAAIGLRRAGRTGRFHRAGPLLIAVFGMAQVAGGVFVADPALGFPVGTADALPEQISWHGHLHTAAFGVGITSLIAASVVWSRRFAASGRLGWARSSMLVAVAFLVLAGAGIASFDFRVVTVAIAIGWGWASALCLAHVRQDAWGR
jgi:hypothetical protein